MEKYVTAAPETMCPFKKNHSSCMQQIRLFNALPKEAQDILAEHAIHTTHPKGTVLAQEGDHIQSVLIIRSGRIKTCRIDPAGDEYILDILHEGLAIWDDMFLQVACYLFSIVSLTEVGICEIRREEFMAILANNPEAAMGLITMLSTELADAKEKAILLSIRSPEVRLAGFLLDRELRCTERIIRLKLDDIAASIGLRPETISRALSRFEKEHLIERKGQGKIVVTDRHALKKLFTNSGKI